jgi:hypothetical protein
MISRAQYRRMDTLNLREWNDQGTRPRERGEPNLRLQ